MASPSSLMEPKLGREPIDVARYSKSKQIDILMFEKENNTRIALN
jgi:hypothetical protein